VNLKFRKDGNAWFVELKKKQKAGDLNSLFVEFCGKPRVSMRLPWQGGVNWGKDKNGNPFIKKIFIRLIALPAPEIINFQTFVDEDWIIKNTNIDTTKPITMQGMNNEIFIYDENKNEQYSLQELSKKTSEEDEEITKDTFRHIEIFENAYIEYNNVKLKLKKFLFDYIRQNPIESNIEIDITKELIGVIEYINQNKKTAVFKDRIIKDW
jgi:hypothetical protein